MPVYLYFFHILVIGNPKTNDKIHVPMKRFMLITMVGLVSMVMMAADGELLYGFYQGSGTLTSLGTRKVESYDVAIHLTDPFLVGQAIYGLRIPVNTSAKKTSDYSAWLTKKLTLAGGKNVPDIASVTFNATSKWVDVTFETPYIITAEGVYAGYSFTVSDVTAEADQLPIQTIATEETGGLFIHTSRTYRQWMELTRVGASALTVRLGGDGIKSYAATFAMPEELNAYTSVGEEATVALSLVNHGTTAIRNIDYTIEVNGTTTERHQNVTLAAQYYGRKKAMNVTIPPVYQRGTRPVTFCITKINGEENQDPQPSAALQMAFLAETPKHKPLMEEYTGTWCGWCPRGMAAMEAMAKLYGDDFVGVAFHEGDAMQITNSFPREISGYPGCTIDRVGDSVDPFGGSAGGSLGIRNDWTRRAAVIAPAALALEAYWGDEAKTLIEVKSTTSFVRNLSDNPYRLTYILVADDLSGSGRYWSQVNNYGGQTGYDSDPYLGPLTKLPGTVIGMKFKDVAIQLSCQGPAALEESLPASVNDIDDYEHTFTFNITNNTLVQDKTKLRVVAALVNTQSGEVVNAEKATVTDDPTSVQRVQRDTEAIGIYYTDMLGRRVSPRHPGIYIKTTTYSDGTVKNEKIKK